MNLLPCPRYLKRRAGFFVLPTRPKLKVFSTLTAKQIQSVVDRLKEFGFQLESRAPSKCSGASIKATQSEAAPNHSEGYTLTISSRGIEVSFRQIGGLCAAVATLRQLLREYKRRLPHVQIRDWPDFPRRGTMLDISRGRVPKLETLLELAEHLADFKINELQLYVEHTFAYRKYKGVWKKWGALTSAEIRKLDTHCRSLGIDLVPNQNSFGHLREFLADPRLKHLGEVSEPYESAAGDFLRYPSTLAPNHPGTLPFLRGLYDELLPNFSSRFFNVGCDETWDLGRGQSRKLCDRKGKGRAYLDFLKRIHREVSSRNLTMMFWGDIILNHPELIRKLPKNLIAINWGYEANQPFEREAAEFAKAKIPFYVCPGTSTWMTLIGKLDNALPNLRAAAVAGHQHGAIGYLITDWGDGGHPQPLAISYLPFAAGAALSWCGNTFREEQLNRVLSRDIFSDPSGKIFKAAQVLGSVHRKLGYLEPNVTPLGAVIAAPPSEERELFCRNGLKYYARIPAHRIQATWKEIERQRRLLNSAKPKTATGKLLQLEIDLAARMAAESCRIMLWQQALAAGNVSAEQKLEREGIRELRRLEKDFERYWPARNKASTQKCSAFLRWRLEDYRQRRLHFTPEAAR